MYVDKLPIQIHNLDKIQVTGSKITWEGKPIILAAEIKRGDQVLKLRDSKGVPVWSGQRRTATMIAEPAGCHCLVARSTVFGLRAALP